MKTIEKDITVNVPVRQAYDQWTQFEEFPRFMEGIEEVRQVDDKHLHWKAKIGGKVEEWDAEIFEQTPDQHIAWRSIGGAKNAGRVSFQPSAPSQTTVHLEIEYEPEGVIETVGDAIGAVDSRVSGDLERFKEFVESRGSSTGEWRGGIHG